MIAPHPVGVSIGLYRNAVELPKGADTPAGSINCRLPRISGNQSSKTLYLPDAAPARGLATCCGGKSAKEIAAALEISVKTIEFHKKHLMDELNLRSSAELIRYAVEKGFVAQ
jgi:hypothetical protein